MSRPRRLSERNRGQDEPLVEGVPDYLRPSLEYWLRRAGMSPDVYRQMALTLRLTFVPGGYDTSDVSPARAAGQYLLDLGLDGEQLLDAIDLLLQFEGGRDTTYKQSILGQLEEMLELGGSAWRVSLQGTSLEWRVSEPVRDAVHKAIEDAEAAGSSAAAHLSEAWQETYGRNPDPSNAYGKAIRAVESAAKPVVSPNDRTATLGTMIGHLRATGPDWECTVYPGTIDTPLAMMESLWRGQSDRHGDTPTVAVEQAETEAAVHLAATLVHWFLSGAVAKREW